MRKLCFLLFLPLLLAACTGSGDKSFTVSGDIKNMPQQQVQLRALSIFEPIVIIDSAATDANGHFELKGGSAEPGIYQIAFSADPDRLLLLSLDKGKVSLTADWGSLNESYNVAGSPASSSLRTLLQVVREHTRDARTFAVIHDTMVARGNDSMVAEVAADIQRNNESLTSFIEHYADSTQFVANALFAARMLNPQTEEGFLTNFVDGLAKRFPGSEIAGTFATQYRSAIQRQQQPEQPAAIAAGSPAKEISLPNPDGKVVPLSSLRGKYVLIDFWASWCPPCRAENPNLVAAFNKYKNRGFTVYGVSLDSKKDAWLEAIKKDGLAWTQVSDLNKWQSAAAQDYGINQIPSNFLVDPQGNIIAQDLRGEELEEKLEEVLAAK